MIEDTIVWFGHASFAIQCGIMIYIDPWKIPRTAVKADLILVSHSHSDHFSLPDINALSTPKTIVITASDCQGDFVGTHVTLLPHATRTICGITIRALPAYNSTKPFHPKKNQWLGFLITTPDGSIYYAGDTDVIDEMYGLAPRVALLPVGGTYTMDHTDAVVAAGMLNAAMIIPYHYGDIVGTMADAEYVRTHARIPVILKEKTQG